MHVAQFVQRYPPALGGSEAYVARLTRWLAGHGIRGTVWTTTALDLDAFWSSRGRRLDLQEGEADGEGVAVRRYHPTFRFRGRRWLLKPLSLFPLGGLRPLTMACNPICPGMWSDAGRAAERYDAVHASAFPYAWPIACALRLARRQDVPFLLTPFLHLGDPTDPRDRTRAAYTSPPLRSLLLAADRVFAQTPSERDAVVDLGVPERNVVLQGLGVDPAECTGGDRTGTRRTWRIDDDEVVIGHLANLSVEKGSVDLLDAAELAWRDGARFRLVLAGPDMANFRARWASFGPRRQVVKLGSLSDEGKRDFFAALDAFALPSRSDSFGLVLLEAWANGLSNVAYRAGGVADLIRHESDGLLVHCGDVRELARALVRVAADGGVRRRWGETGRRRAEREFRWQDKLEVFRKALDELAPCPKLPAADPVDVVNRLGN